jgi:phenylpropionate dioxygenase-like ring-hydroxylating dioxygenase large terminal subunit
MNKAIELTYWDLFPELGVAPVPAAPYISNDWYQREVARVFKTCWLHIGRADEVPEAGSYRVKRLDFARTSLILTRDGDGCIRAFHNICSHRGNKVVWGDECHGKARGGGLVCRFHGWVYGMDGSVLSIPEIDRFVDLDRQSLALPEVHAEVWEGFVFVNLAPRPTSTLKDYLGEAGTRFAGFPFETMTAAYRYRTVLKCNWKVAQDAFSEGYHVPTIHAGSFPGSFDTKLLNVRLYGPHRSAGAAQIMDEKPKPVAALAHGFANTSIAKPGQRSNIPEAINPGQNPNFGFDLCVFFPNFLLHVTEGFYFTHQFWPLSVDETLWEGVQFFVPPQNAGERFAHEYGQVLQRNAWLEDTATMEDTHAALKSGVRKEIHLQEGEVLIRHHMKVIEEMLNAELPLGDRGRANG